MGSPPKLTRQPTQLTISGSAGSRQVRHHPGSCSGPSGGPQRLCPAHLSLLITADSTLATSVGLTPTELRAERQATTALRTLTDSAARADYSALKVPLPARSALPAALSCPSPSRLNLHCGTARELCSSLCLVRSTCQQLSLRHAASSQAVRV